MEEETSRSDLGLSLIKQLASSDHLVRDKALSLVLTQWLPTQTLVSDDLMMKLWKGLFYCVWHSDKAPAQTLLADKLSSSLLDLAPSVAVHFLSAFLVTLRREWSGIDVYRLDKFYLLIRRFVFNSFAHLRNGSWDLEMARVWVRVFEERVFFAGDKFQGNGVSYHIASVVLDEIVSFLPIRGEVVEAVFGVFVKVVGRSVDRVLVGKVRGNVFDVLVKKGRDFIESRKSGTGCGSDVEVFGPIALSMGFSGKFYELGSSPDCLQGNRKAVFALHEDFSRLEKDFALTGIDASALEFEKEKGKEEEEEVPELVPIVPEEGVALKRCNAKKKKKKDKKKKKKNSEPEEDVGPDGESAISNLQLEFEKIAAESGLDENDVPSSCDSPKSAVSKKRKRAKPSNDTPNNEAASKSGDKKKVKFSMKNNIVWKPQNPLPPQSLRLPPSATPRGSAMKKGVPAGPIREINAAVPVAQQQPKRAKLRVKKPRKTVKRLKKKSVSPPS